MRDTKLTVDDITGVVGIIPTPSIATADQPGTAFSVDLDEAATLADAMVRGGGVDVLMTTGTFGECASLTWDELQSFVATVVDAVAGRIPVFAGATTLNTRDTITRGGRRLGELGADGLFVGRPMWLPLDDAGIVRFYRDVAEAVPNMALVVYDNPRRLQGKDRDARLRGTQPDTPPGRRCQASRAAQWLRLPFRPPRGKRSRAATAA